MSCLDFSLNEDEIKSAITWFYREKLGRIVSVTLNKKKTRKNPKSRYEPVIDFSIIDTINLGNVRTYTLNTIDSDFLGNILNAYFIEKEGIVVKDFSVNSYIDRKKRKNNVYFENVSVLCDLEPTQSQLNSVNNIDSQDVHKLNKESIVFNAREIYGLIKEYYKIFENRNIEVEYMYQNETNRSCFEKEKVNIDGQNIEYVSLRDYKKDEDKKCFIVRDNKAYQDGDKESFEYITEGKFKSMISKLFSLYGYELDTISMNSLIDGGDGYDYVSYLLKLYVNVHKKPKEQDLAVDNDDYFYELRTEKPKKLTLATRIKSFFSSSKVKR